MIPNFRPIHLAFEKTSSCISLKHIATITIPRSKYKVHNALIRLALNPSYSIIIDAALLLMEAI